jgi:hypothetical protein
VTGVKTWDEDKKENFTLRAVLLWTIKDFPAYAMLSGWSTKGKFACPYCQRINGVLMVEIWVKALLYGSSSISPSEP